jgi:glycosyltransferase involved in cell wall biosynthesis
MNITRFIQIVPALVEGDAISDYARLVRKIYAPRFRESLIFSTRQVGRPAQGERSLAALDRPGRDALVLYHHSTGDEAAEVFLRLRGCKRAVFYHNITPPELLEAVPDMAARSHRGILQLDRLAGEIGEWLAASDFSAGDLRRRGGARVQVVPYGISREKENMLAAGAAGRGATVPPVVLFVGRLVPHKAVDDVIRVFATLLRATGGLGRLVLVGSDAEAVPYAAGLRNLAASLAGDRVHFAGALTGQPLAHAFANAGVYLSMSRHEGVGLPLCEAMFAEVPVVAADHGAVRETVGSGGLVIAEADVALFAEAVQAMLFDSALRAQIVCGQRSRRAIFTQEALSTRLLDALDAILSGE